MFIVFAVVLLFFGSKAIPDIARMLGKGLNEFQKASEEIKNEVRRGVSDIEKDMVEVSKVDQFKKRLKNSTELNEEKASLNKDSLDNNKGADTAPDKDIN